MARITRQPEPDSCAVEYIMRGTEPNLFELVQLDALYTHSHSLTAPNQIGKLSIN